MRTSKITIWGIHLLIFWGSLLLITQQNLRYLDEKQLLASRRKHRHLSTSLPSTSFRTPFQSNQVTPLKFIIFQGADPGQGAGNTLNGLLAAHLLADEFDRILCISPAYEDFWPAFDFIHPDTIHYCPKVIKAWEDQMDAITPLKRGRRRSYKNPPKELLLKFSNFGQHPVDECDLKAKLSSESPVWYLQTNTYPRWPSGVPSIPKHYFHKYYRPKTDLLDFLPATFPSTVVHLRKEDGPSDIRKGLDNQTLLALEAYLEGQSPYLVTNHVGYYQRFKDWSHPNWDSVVHSAVLGVKGDKEYRRRQTLQLWADWYILLQAKTVLHTYSDFSASAVHWMEPTSQSARILRGYTKNNTLELAVELWRREGYPQIMPLVQRSSDQLLHCSKRNFLSAKDVR